jgi:hypothetical protein
LEQYELKSHATNTANAANAANTANRARVGKLHVGNLFNSLKLACLAFTDGLLKKPVPFQRLMHDTHDTRHARHTRRTRHTQLISNSAESA